MNEGIEVDFHPVGRESQRSGDAISVRYGAPGAYTIHIVDGGTTESAEEMVASINKYYGNPQRIDALVLTHADDDHSSGLRTILDNFEVGSIYMNRPWLYAADTIGMFEDDFSIDGLTRRLREAYPILAEIEDTAEERGIPVYEAFQGTPIGAFTVLAPSRQRYINLIPEFSRTPDSATGATGIVGQMAAAVRDVLRSVTETWEFETLEDVLQNPTTPSNESSVVQIGVVDGKKVLLTGDAGVDALTEAADYAETLGFQLPGLDCIQMPHHGSRRNISRPVLNRWVGEPVANGSIPHFSAIASVAGECETHPRQKVINAFLRRGAKVASTKKSKGGVAYQHKMAREGWGSALSHEFDAMVEE